MVIAAVSTRGEEFILAREDVVLRAYADIGGVVTIGPGLTMLSKVFKAYWLKTRGRLMKKGDTMTRAEAVKVFRDVLSEEYGPPVVGLNPQEQNVFDGELSVVYNCGPGAASWNWAQALKAGRIADGCKLLLTTAVTAAGKPSAGLRNRRAMEAKLIGTGDYSDGEGATIGSEAESVKEYQAQLKTLGFYSGAVDGDRGALTKGAVSNFQRASGLNVDGNVGPATRAALIRAIGLKTQAKAIGGAVPGIPAATGFGFHIDNLATLLLIGIGVAAVLTLAFLVWNNRGVLFSKRTPA